MRERGYMVAMVMALCGCDGDASTPTPKTVDAAVVRTRALAYKDGGFERVTREARPSQHAGDDVHIWVSSGQVTAYLEVVPDALTAAPEFPEGTMIVKEQLDQAGTLSALTVMYKGPSGSGAGSDDWYWARIEPDGTASFEGQVEFCIACHTPRREVDWVFGAEADNRAR